MTLSFSTKINGKQNYFVEKIWRGFYDLNPQAVNNTITNYLNKGYVFSNIVDQFPKIHTIREDKNDRWKVNNDIHFVINNRTKNRFQFAPIIKCKGIQYISITYIYDYPIVHIGSTQESCMPFYWENPNDNEDGYGVEQMKELAMNDGFNSIEDFFKYFDSDFTGKIIHWTDFRYCA